MQREALQSISLKSLLVSEAIAAGSVTKAVTNAAEVASELRTISVGSLPVKLYNDVFAAVEEVLGRVQAWIVRERNVEEAAEAFRKAQESSQIVPRLYISAAACGAWCELDPSMAKENFSEMMDLLGGVQHPLRGIFLRSFVTQQLRCRTVELGVTDSIRFLLRNLVEMTRLWVRMDSRRDSDRKEIKVLVGQTLSALGRLDLDSETYARTVLPRLEETILSCPEPFAQEYLAECLVQVFPDQLHLSTLDSLLGMCQTLSKGVRLRVVVSALTERLGVFVSTSPEGAQLAADADAFGSLASHLPAIEARMADKLSLVDRLGMYLALLRYSLRAEAGVLDQVDTVLGFVLRAVKEVDLQTGTEAEGLVVAALTEPLVAQRSVAAALELDNFRELSSRLAVPGRRTVASTMLKSVTDFPPCISQVGDLERLFELVGALVDDEEVGEDDEEAQTLVARIVYLLDDTDSLRLFGLYDALRTRLARGGVQKARITFPSLVFGCLRLAVRVADKKSECIRVCEFASETIGALTEADPLLALLLYLEGVATTAQCENPAMVYDFLSHAIVLYEIQLEQQAKSAFNGLTLVLGALADCAGSLDANNYATLTNRLCKYANHLPNDAERYVIPDYCFLLPNALA